MPEPNEELQESTEEEEAVDFDNPDSRMSFLKSQLNDLLDGINDVYGQDLMEELLKRLEKTVEAFNTEVSGLIGKLKDGKIFEEESDTSEGKRSDESDDGEDLEKSFDDMESEDADVIAKMRARHPHE
ncbi:hypothetical protein HQ531_09920 [bacterium]|nr:hypothetical protein [bacterium]